MRLTRCLYMPHTLPKPPKARKYVRLWNNRWHEGRMREVENLGYVEACKEKGIQVIDAKVSYCTQMHNRPVPNSSQLPCFLNCHQI